MDSSRTTCHNTLLLTSTSIFYGHCRMTSSMLLASGGIGLNGWWQQLRLVFNKVADVGSHFSTGLWAFAVLMLLLNVDGWLLHLWVSFLPLIMVLIVGTKLQHIMTTLAVRITQTDPVTEGMPDVTPQDDLFWFRRPQLILRCIHFSLFQSAMEISFHIWASFSFSSENCLNSDHMILLLEIVIGALTQIICGYITLPTYALVAQMGSHIKKSVFDRHTQLALAKWHLGAKRNIKESSHGERHQSGRTENVEEGSTSSYTSNSLSLHIKPLRDGGGSSGASRNSTSTHEMVIRQRIASPITPDPPPMF